VVTQAGGLPLGGLRELGAGVELVRADVARPPGVAHDSAKLAAVLAELLPYRRTLPELAAVSAAMAAPSTTSSSRVGMK
jgi:hypothetical protein